MKDAAIGVSERDLLEYQDDDEISNDYAVEEKFTKMSNKLMDIMSNSVGEDEELTGSNVDLLQKDIIDEQMREINGNHRSFDSNYGGYDNLPLVADYHSSKK